MHKRSTFLYLLLFLLPAFTYAQCKSSVVNIDSIFNYWSGIRQQEGTDSLSAENVELDTIIILSDSSGTYGTIHLRLGSADGGLDFSFNDFDTFNADNFFPDLFSNDSPFGFSLDFDNMFQQLENMFEDFKGIEIIPQPGNNKVGGKPVYRI